jgi:hypothetical protein
VDYQLIHTSSSYFCCAKQHVDCHNFLVLLSGCCSWLILHAQIILKPATSSSQPCFSKYVSVFQARSLMVFFFEQSGLSWSYLEVWPLCAVASASTPMPRTLASSRCPCLCSRLGFLLYLLLTHTFFVNNSHYTPAILFC